MYRALLISTGVGCGVLCSYCPQVAIGRAYKQRVGPTRMSMDTFKACVEKLPQDVTIDFTGFYEPFLNPDCAEMLLHAAQTGHSVRLSTTVSGLTTEQIDRIKHLPFVKFAVHLPDSKALTRIVVDNQYLRSIAHLVQSGISNLAFHVHEGPDGPEPMHPDVQAILDENAIAAENRWVNTRAGSIDVAWKTAPQRLSGPLQYCPRLRQNVLLPNGDVALCCMDWKLEHTIGNLLVDRYEDLFESAVYKQVLRGHFDESVDLLCRGCEVARPLQGTLTNADQDRAEAG